MKPDSPALLVVGAGPAGTSAAISAAMSGADAVVIDVQAFPRDRPGESLPPGIQPLMAQLGLESQLLSAGFPRHEGVWVEWDTGRRFEEFGRDSSGPWRGFQAWRAEFDAMLLDRARRLGVVVRQPCRAITPIIESGRVVGAESSQGPIFAQCVIDAAGGSHWLARQLGILIELHSPKLLATYGYDSNCPSPDERLPEIIADRDGWTWRAKVRPDLYHYTRLRFDGNPEKHAVSEVGSLARGADVTWRCVAEPAGPGYFCTGDAASVLDPASSHGVLRAVMTGIMAADIQRQIHGEPARELHLIRGYNRWLRGWFQEDLAKLRELYGQLPNPPTWISGSRSHRPLVGGA